MNLTNEGWVPTDALFPYQPGNHTLLDLAALRAVRESTLTLLNTIEDNVTPCPERTHAITRLRETYMWTVAAITAHPNTGVPE